MSAVLESALTAEQRQAADAADAALAHYLPMAAKAQCLATRPADAHEALAWIAGLSLPMLRRAASDLVLALDEAKHAAKKLTPPPMRQPALFIPSSITGPAEGEPVTVCGVEFEVEVGYDHDAGQCWADCIKLEGQWFPAEDVLSPHMQYAIDKALIAKREAAQ